MSSHQGQYCKSSLLSAEENEDIRNIYTPKKEVLALTVAQLHHASPDPRYWEKQTAGIIALVKDHNQRSYFIQFINVDTRQITHSEELYLELEYKTPSAHFHTFAGEKCTVGLNFCHDGEAQKFKDEVNGVTTRNKRRKEKIDHANRPPAVQITQPPPTPVAPPPSEPLSKKDKKKDKKEKKKKGKGGISKADISGPSNFQHLSHLGWDKNKNQFDEGAIDPSLRELLASAGVTTNDLKDESTAQFIQDFVDNHGGIDTLKEKQRRSSRISHGRPPPPAPPSGRQGPPQGRQPPPQRSGPPPPPTRQSQPPPNQRGGRTAPPPPANVKAAPPAPRAPAAPAAPAAPPAPRAPAAPAAPRAPPVSLSAVAPGAPTPQSGRGNLMDEIRRGRDLKSAPEGDDESESSGGGGGGGDFLSQIRGFGGAAGGGLKSGAARHVPHAPSEEDELEGMAGALARALAARKDATHDNSDSDDDSDDDWSD